MFSSFSTIARRQGFRCDQPYWVPGFTPSTEEKEDPYLALSKKISLYNGGVMDLEVDTIVNAAQLSCMGMSFV